MKRNVLAIISILALAGGAVGCAGNGEYDASTDPVGEPVVSEQQEIVTGAVGPLFWPTGPITWDGDIGTWPIAIWSNSPINWLALDIPGATMLGFDLMTFDGMLMNDFSPFLINSTTLDLVGVGDWMGGLWPAYGMLPWMYGLGGYPYYGVPGYVYGLGYTPYVDAGLWGGASSLSTATVGGLGFPGLFPAGLGASSIGSPLLLPSSTLLSPTLTSSALMLDTFPLITGTTPLLLNVRFSGLTAASMASLNLFAAQTAASSLAIQATVFPIMGLPLGI